MASLAIDPRNSRQYSIRLNSAAADADSDLMIALDAAVLKTGADVAVVYLFNAEASEFISVARFSELPLRAADVCAMLNDLTVEWLEDLSEPTQGKPSQDAFFGRLPEVLQYRLRRVLAAPLRGTEDLLGILTIGRSEDRDFNEEEVGFAQRSARLLAAAIERDLLQRKLAERKLVERAKGILQQRRRLSEEQAYFLLRNTSRRRHKPMAELAKEIIETQLASPLARQVRPAL
jgi:GAF domain-containing protein